MTAGFLTHRPRWTIALSSLLWAFCYPPFPLGWLGFAVLAPAFIATAGLRPRAAFAAHFAAGLFYNSVMYWWIYNVMKVGPALVIGLGLIGLILFLSLFNGLLGLGFRLAADRPALLSAFPLAWAGLEAARAVGEMSFPWNNLGYVLGYWPRLIQSASLFGIYGLSALLVAANVFLFLAWRDGRRRRIWLAAWALVPAAMLLHGAFLPRNPVDAPSLDIALVQPSIPQTKKWDEAYFKEVMDKTFRVMDGPPVGPSPLQGADLVLLAETAVPDFLRSRPEIVDSLGARASRLQAPVLVGALDFVPDRKPWREYRFYNSTFLFSPDSGRKVEQYSKLRLVPFSEKLPFENLFPILNYVNLGEGDFSPGDGYRVWGDGARYSPSICYEIIYPDFVRRARAAGARFLVNVTNDGWFGRSNGPHQHANISRFRAVETGLPIARCSNTGISVFYDAWGRDLGHTRLMDSTVLRRHLPIPDRETLYARVGGALDGFYLLSLGGWILAAASLGWRNRKAGVQPGS